jgi:uncharacterized membrane protein
MKVKLTLGDVIYVTFMFLCSLILIINTIFGWWYINHVGFSLKQLCINLVVSLSTIWWFRMAFKYIFIIEIKKIKNNV